MNLRQGLYIQNIVEIGNGNLGEAERRFIEEITSLFEPWGMARSVGRFYGYLMLCDAPVSLEKIAADLQMSKSGACAGSSGFPLGAPTIKSITWPVSLRMFFCLPVPWRRRCRRGIVAESKRQYQYHCTCTYNVDVRIENANRGPQNQAPVNEGSGSARQWLQRWPAGMARQRFSGDVLRNDGRDF
ncbi:MAG: hypothetical protein WCE20_15380, partial [Rhizomicrobium sp.]